MVDYSVIPITVTTVPYPMDHIFESFASDSKVAHTLIVHKLHDNWKDVITAIKVRKFQEAPDGLLPPQTDEPYHYCLPCTLNSYYLDSDNDKMLVCT